MSVPRVSTQRSMHDDRGTGLFLVPVTARNHHRRSNIETWSSTGARCLLVPLPEGIVTAMRKRRLLRVAAFSLVALSLHVYVIPLRVNAEIRAVSCCAARCHHARSAAGASRCCGLEQVASDIAGLSATPSANGSAPSTMLQSSIGAAVAQVATAASDSRLRRLIRAAPIFLFTHSLRL